MPNFLVRGLEGRLSFSLRISLDLVGNAGLDSSLFSRLRISAKDLSLSSRKKLKYKELKSRLRR